LIKNRPPSSTFDDDLDVEARQAVLRFWLPPVGASVLCVLLTQSQMPIALARAGWRVHVSGPDREYLSALQQNALSRGTSVTVHAYSDSGPLFDGAADAVIIVGHPLSAFPTRRLLDVREHYLRLLDTAIGWVRCEGRLLIATETTLGLARQTFAPGHTAKCIGWALMCSRKVRRLLHNLGRGPELVNIFPTLERPALLTRRSGSARLKRLALSHAGNRLGPSIGSMITPFDRIFLPDWISPAMLIIVERSHAG
jgi:hypothetical protein